VLLVSLIVIVRAEKALLNCSLVSMKLDIVIQTQLLGIENHTPSLVEVECLY
jgi:hypothetical protein